MLFPLERTIFLEEWSYRQPLLKNQKEAAETSPASFGLYCRTSCGHAREVGAQKKVVYEFQKEKLGEKT
jgi:hypothetical protein